MGSGSRNLSTTDNKFPSPFVMIFVFILITYRIIWFHCILFTTIWFYYRKMVDNQRGFFFVYVTVLTLLCTSIPASSFSLPRIARTDDAIIIDCILTTHISILPSFNLTLIIFQFQLLSSENLLIHRYSILTQWCNNQRLTAMGGLIHTPIPAVTY